ncbi:hypothetical protein EVAR_49177_1 [Eumeta japonica]|uniref:Uncharacterized protein n=1 Tax=Eumeta variegata TaxID=151549 RepID=A0A4C1YEQ4_EUMVA|nr:hypothetical protein EVAR_49177_1 [Eumeta japonica]
MNAVADPAPVPATAPVLPSALTSPRQTRPRGGSSARSRRPPPTDTTQPTCRFIKGRRCSHERRKGKPRRTYAAVRQRRPLPVTCMRDLMCLRIRSKNAKPESL